MVALCTLVATSASSLGDYPQDAGPAIDALANGRVADFLRAHPDMGPVSTLLRAPFAAFGGSQLDAYRLGALACLLAVGALGLYLASIAARRGVGRLGQVLLAGACVINPLTFAALDAGHPEELLTAALAVAAVALASRGHRARAALLLGLAVATKQWAVIAVLPVLMALPAGRMRAALLAAGVAVALMLPGALAAPGDFFETQRSLAIETQYVTPWSAWYPGSNASTVHLPEIHATAHPHHASALVARFSHPLILLAALLLPLGLALRRRSLAVSGPDAMALLALLALLRCLLDPVDNLYYHAPLLLALAGWDALAARSLPYRVLLGAAVLELLSRWQTPTLDPAPFNALYLGVAGIATAALVAVLWQGKEFGSRARTDVRPILGTKTYLDLPLQE